MADCYPHATFTPKAEYNGTIDSQAFVHVPLEGWDETINDGENDKGESPSDLSKNIKIG